MKIGILSDSHLKSDYTKEVIDFLKEIIEEIDEAKSKALIKDFEKEKIQILNGQYGAYIKQGRKNFKIPKTKVAENLTLEECLEIIEKDSKVSKKPTRKTATKITTKKVSTKAKKE